MFPVSHPRRAFRPLGCFSSVGPAFTRVSDLSPLAPLAGIQVVVFICSSVPLRALPCPFPQHTPQAGIQIGRAELLDDTMVKVLNKANNTKHREATTLLFELSVRARGSGNWGVEATDVTHRVLFLCLMRHAGLRLNERHTTTSDRSAGLFSAILYPPSLQMCTTPLFYAYHVYLV